MARALVVYSSRTGQTRQIGELIAEGLRMAGVEAEVKDAARITKVEHLAGYDAYVFGSATYHGEMMPPMKTMLFLAEKAGLAGKAGGAFGAWDWSGEALDRIYNTMHHVFNMDMASDALRLKSAALQGALAAAHDYGRQIAKKIGAV